MSVRTRVTAAAVVGGALSATLLVPMQAMTSAKPTLPIQVGVTQRGEVCYSANADGSLSYCTDPILN